MATYSQIQTWVTKQYGFTPETCWIAHMKELEGLKPRRAANRLSPTVRQKPCPVERRPAIKAALKHFGMIL